MLSLFDAVSSWWPKKKTSKKKTAKKKTSKKKTAKKKTAKKKKATRFESKLGWNLYDPRKGEIVRRATKAERNRQLKNPDGYLRVKGYPHGMIVI